MLMVPQVVTDQFVLPIYKLTNYTVRKLNYRRSGSSHAKNNVREKFCGIKFSWFCSIFFF